MNRILRIISLSLAAFIFAAPAGAQEASSREFQVGDRILLFVEGDTVLTDTFTVQVGPAITLPVLGAVPLKGVRRADVDAHMKDQIGKYFKSTTVSAKALVRLAIEGEVAYPGFYAIPTDIVLSDALMAAGGLTQEAKMSDMKIDRAGMDVMTGSKLQVAVAQGQTIDQLGLRAGDRIYVPRLVRRDMESFVRTIAIILTIPVGIYTLTQIF